MGTHIWEWLDGVPLRTEVAETFGMWAVMPFVLLIAGRYFGVTLTQSTAVVHNLRRRTIQWADIQAILIEPFQGTRTVVIYEADGRRTRLRAPITGFLSWDSGFDEKFQTIGTWWLEHRGPGWAPVPPPRASGKGPSAPRDPFAPPA
ncbi:hypothetical protein [Streptomyces canus]|uniref:PH domain-containing protein n=1 Tax=Streptomyces canus TaxID=58343 RepID=A0AAW8FGN7_9ACTN|nr:hypothetical protein [Streptomyces canus]MDQ0762213.1 hypothetical protein [Streptomyces canus]MDQ0909306.1 hypothetical protein [Streptomyces canus]MDQ1069348.1 hypothetical protein [Streptomyces canus]